MKPNFAKKTPVGILVLVFACLSFWLEYQGVLPSFTTRSSPPRATGTEASGSDLEHAFNERRSNLQVTASGVVSKVLPDDRDGSSHQRFIVKLPSGMIVLIAHNIDLAPRIPDLKSGQEIRFHGEYEWNEKGGVVHWTHKDPNGRHEDGWLEMEGQRFE